MPTLMAGPREAYLQAQMLDNLKMKNFIVGRDHAGYKNFFSKYASQSIFKKKRDYKKGMFDLFAFYCMEYNTIIFKIFEDNKRTKITFEDSLMKNVNSKDSFYEAITLLNN